MLSKLTLTQPQEGGAYAPILQEMKLRLRTLMCLRSLSEQAAPGAWRLGLILYDRPMPPLACGAGQYEGQRAERQPCSVTSSCDLGQSLTSTPQLPHLESGVSNGVLTL